METWNPQARTGWVEAVGEPGSGRAALQGSVKLQSLGDTWHSKKQRGAISWPVPSGQCDDTRKHWDAKWIMLRWTKCSWKLCTTAWQRKTPRGAIPHMVLSCPRDDVRRCWDGKVDHSCLWRNSVFDTGRGREGPYHQWCCHANVMRCWDAEVDWSHSWETYSTTGHLAEEEERCPIMNGLPMPVRWDARCWDAKVDHPCSENCGATAQLLTWDGADRGPVTNGPTPSWWDAEMLRWTVTPLENFLPPLNTWHGKERRGVLSWMVSVTATWWHAEMLRSAMTARRSLSHSSTLDMGRSREGSSHERSCYANIMMQQWDAEMYQNCPWEAAMGHNYAWKPCTTVLC